LTTFSTKGRDGGIGGCEGQDSGSKDVVLVQSGCGVLAMISSDGASIQVVTNPLQPYVHLLQGISMVISNFGDLSR